MLFLMRCSALKKADGSFAPAYILADGRLERAGRATQKVQHTSAAAIGSAERDRAGSILADDVDRQQQQNPQARAHL